MSQRFNQNFAEVTKSEDEVFLVSGSKLLHLLMHDGFL